MERGVFAGVADADDKFAGIDGPLMRRVVPVAEGAGVQVESYMPGFAGSQTNLLKAFRLALRANDFSLRIGDVELGHFSPGHAAGVGYVEAD